MNNFIEQIKRRLRLANIVEQFIYLNIAVFILSYLLETLAWLVQGDTSLVTHWFALQDNFPALLSKPWTLVTYGFLHGDFLHILFNLIVLFYFGNLFLDFFSKRDFLIYYFLGIVLGGLVYILSYTYFPSLKNENSILVGASAGIMAIVIGIATKIPNYAMHFRFIGGIKLWYIALGLVLFDLIQLPAGNTGGHLAHLGGALTGYLLTHFALGSGKRSGGSLFNLFRSKKQKPLKTVYKNKAPQKPKEFDTEHQKKIDSILDKISKSGYEALSREEKDFLFKTSKK